MPLSRRLNSGKLSQLPESPNPAVMAPSLRTSLIELRRLPLVAILVAAGLAFAAEPARADLTEALRAYQRGEFEAAAAELIPLAEEGDPQAQYLVGRMRFYGQVLLQDAAAAARWYRRAAEQGFSPAQLAFAIALDGGWGVPRDPAEAARWYRIAALQGERGAMWRLAYHYRRGIGVPRDLVEAWAWFDRLAAFGDERAAGERDWLGLIGLDEELILQAEARSAALARELPPTALFADTDRFAGEGEGPALDRGLIAAQSGDWDRARREWQARAREGDAMAQFRLARLYAEGRGVKRDPLQAERWLKEAAAQGHVAAQLDLAELYEAGDGVAPDPVEAMAWLLVALHALKPGPEREEAEAATAALGAALTEEQRLEAEGRAARHRNLLP